MIRRVSLVAVACAAALVWSAGSAAAQVTFGVRGGGSGDPDQFHLGGHIESGDLGHRVTFRPNVEVGFGSDVTLITANLELVHYMPLKDSRWQIYAGGGIGTNVWLDDEDNLLSGVFNVVFGAQHDKGLFAEMKVGMTPSVKLTVGYSMKLGG